MRLSNVLKLAKTTSLKQVSTKDKTDEVVIGYINLALEDLYSKFLLKTEEIIIALQDGKTTYLLDGTDSDVTVGGNVMDLDDVISLVEAYDENGPIGINDDTNPLSVYTSSYDELQIPAVEDGAYVSIIYKKAPEEVAYVDSGDGSATDQNIPLPRGLRAALLAYIKYAALDSSSDVQVSAANEAKYERACKKAEEDGVIPQDALTRKDTKGFTL